ncbi:MAG: iron ABC transporter permease [Chloroflexi bacterium]|nr:iron ABC transporter permease [Chloroflexota bacterium]
MRDRARLASVLRTAGLWAAPAAFLALFYARPLAEVLRLSLARGASLAAPFAEALTSPVQREIFGFTLLQASLSTLLTLAVGLPGAYLLARFEFRGRSLLQALTAVPFVMPTLVVGAAFHALLGPRGWANLALMELFQLSEPPLQILHTLGAILLAHVFYNTSIVLRLVGDFWSHLDPRLEAAARTLGANRRQVLLQVTLPLLLPAIAAAALLVFLFDFTSFGVILVLGGPRLSTLEVEIYNQTVGLFNLPLAAALSILQLGCTLLLTVVYTRLSGRLSRPISLRPRRQTAQRLRGPRRRLAAGALVALLLLLMITPLLALTLRSFVRFDPAPGPSGQPTAALTLEAYRELWVNRQGSAFYVPPTTAMGVSLAFAAATVGLSLALGLPAAWALAYRPESGASRLFDPLLLLPLGTSAVTLGLGFIVTLNRPPLDLRASPLLVPLAHTLVALPFVVRSLTPALRSIRPRLRHAGAVLGADPLSVITRIDLPLVGRALLVAAAFAFTISLGEFGATALVARPDHPTVPMMIYRFLSLPGALNYGQALALSTLLMLACAAGMLGIERLRIADVGEF